MHAKRSHGIALVMLAVGTLAGACGSDRGTDRDPMPAPTSAVRIEDAPIDQLDILILESFPVQYNLRILSGLPSGCHQFDRAEITGRNDHEIAVRVTNTVPDEPDLACTAIYGTHESTVPLGSDFDAGATYTVRVNEKTTTFTAQ